jgi:hypothetical protein
MHIVALVLAVVTGAVVLVGYFIPAAAPGPVHRFEMGNHPGGNGYSGWSVQSCACAGSKISRREKGGIYSAILLICLFATFVIGLVLGPDHPGMRLVVNSIVVPVEATMMALLAVTLIYASIRLLRRRASLISIVFIGTALLMLVASATLPFGEIGALNNFLRPWFQHVLARGSTRSDRGCGTLRPACSSDGDRATLR